jgi:hypothetical protein
MFGRIKPFRILMGAVLLVLGCSLPLQAAEPMPYTDEAVAKIDGAMETVRVNRDISEGDDQKVKAYIEGMREVFSRAGYDYERSIIRIINDIQFDRYWVNRATIRLNALARELLRVHVRSGVNPRKFLGKDCAELLIEFRNLIRSNSKKYGSC